MEIVQVHYAHKYRAPKDEIEAAFNHLFNPEETLGKMTGISLHLPGHTADYGA
jgi:lactate dehydrogenase-like 2-hydroxyacid dehydrogenase